MLIELIETMIWMIVWSSILAFIFHIAEITIDWMQKRVKKIRSNH
jgi:hypothetical protein